MIKYDYHSHSNYSSDAHTPMDKMIERAIDLGLTEFAITDHVDFAYPSSTLTLSGINIKNYFDELMFNKRKYRHKIKVIVGVELSIRPDIAHICQALTESYAWDFVIGSTHDVKGLDWYYQESYEGKSKQQAYQEYFENMLECIKTCDCFDVIGHLDYVERYPRMYEDKALHYSDYADIIDEILTLLIKKGKGIEVNTSGFYYNLGRPQPQRAIIARYIELGGKIITVGSDAHRPDNIAAHFGDAWNILQELGVKKISQFDGRKVF